MDAAMPWAGIEQAWLGREGIGTKRMLHSTGLERPMREWVTVAPENAGLWAGLVAEAHHFVEG